jgi:transcriptional regulator with XRE-family HTH domain
MELDFRREEIASDFEEGRNEAFDRVKSPFRMQYAAETKIFLNQYGGLENIRQKLGFSRRKMCQLLLVDPSAWTRWMKDESKVPPHIYRALEWFLALNEKALTQPDLAAIFTARYKAAPQNSDQKPGFLIAEIESLKTELKRQRLISLCVMGGLFMLGLSLGFLLLRAH